MTSLTGRTRLVAEKDLSDLVSEIEQVRKEMKNLVIERVPGELVRSRQTRPTGSASDASKAYSACLRNRRTLGNSTSAWLFVTRWRG